MFRNKWLTLIVLALLAPGTLASLGYAQDRVIKIGSMYPMTGRAGLYGLDSVDAAEMAIEDINSRGGVAGYKLELLNNDDKSKPDYAIQLAKRYITEDKVHFLFGVVSSAVGLAVTEVSKQYKKIFIGTDHASTQLTTDKLQPYYPYNATCQIWVAILFGACHTTQYDFKEGDRLCSPMHDATNTFTRSRNLT